MSARHKLNQANLIGVVIVAGAFGAVCESWYVFAIAVAVLAAGALHGGAIRVGSQRNQRM